MKWGFVSAQKLEAERAIVLPLSISPKTKAIRSYFRVPQTGKYPPSCWKLTQSWSKSRCDKGGLKYFASLKMKWGYIFA